MITEILYQICLILRFEPQSNHHESLLLVCGQAFYLHLHVSKVTFHLLCVLTCLLLQLVTLSADDSSGHRSSRNYTP